MVNYHHAKFFVKNYRMSQYHKGGELHRFETKSFKEEKKKLSSGGQNNGIKFKWQQICKVT